MCIEVIDDVLEWMQEGWIFGERQSSLQIAGYVPSVNAARWAASVCTVPG